MGMHLTKDGFGIVPSKYNRTGEIIMRLSTTALILNKKQTEYTAKDGSVKQSYKVTISQDNNNIISELSVNSEIFQTLIQGKDFELICEYRSTRSGGNYMVVISAKPAKTAL